MTPQNSTFLLPFMICQRLGNGYVCSFFIFISIAYRLVSFCSPHSVSPSLFWQQISSVFRRCSDGVRRCLSVPYVIVSAVAVHSICHRCFCSMSYDASGHGSNTLIPTLRRSGALGYLFVKRHEAAIRSCSVSAVSASASLVDKCIIGNSCGFAR